MRNWRSTVSWCLVVGAAGAVTVAAAFADGRVGSETRTNDGGAWLLNRSEDSIGHVNRVVGEVASVAGPFDGAFEVAQAPGVVAVANRGAGQAVLIDTTLSAPGAPVAVSATTAVHAIPGAVVLYDPATGELWRLAKDEFGAAADVTEAGALVAAAPGGVLAVGRDGHLALAEPSGDQVHLVEPDGTTSVRRLTEPEPEPVAGEGLDVVESDDPVVDATLVGDVPVLLRRSGEVVVATGDPATHRPGRVVRLQQPSLDGDDVVVVEADGGVLALDLATGGVAAIEGAVSGVQVAPIVHAGCVWSLTFEPVVFHYCGRDEPLPIGGVEVTLTLVNGWVWVNDVNAGGIWFVDEDDLELNQISDWSAALSRTDETEVVEDAAGGDEELVENANADELAENVDELDDDAQNSPPVAEDDTASTRRGRAVVVDVLANDTDEDHDPLTVDQLAGVDPAGLTPDGAHVAITADGGHVQVVPAADFTGTLTFGYVVHDGRQGRDDAQVTVTVTEPDPDTNRPPVTELDNATVRAGEQVSLNVLTNDDDPDGDILVLVAANAPGGDGSAVNFTPDGEIAFIPDITSPDGTVELAYTVADDFGAESSGTVRVRVRNADSNQAPDARNDIGHTSVGHSVVLQTLANDHDPDGDPLIAQNLQSADGSQTSAQLALDGTFLFRPEAPGSYRFTYAVSDGPTTDVAQIRVDVDPETDNRPPVAVTDRVALAVGESRMVRVLDNDGDPDGDIVGIVDWVSADGLDVSEIPGVGFTVRATPSAPARTEFRYWISDGVAEPVMGTVVVSALAREPVDYPPIARVDVVDVRPGHTTTVHVLRNDHDPEGKFLDIVGPLAQPPEALVRIAPDRQALLVTVDPAQQFGFRFSYDVEDPGGNRASAVVQVRIVAADLPNRNPLAGPDIATTPHATPVVIPALANDTDPDGDPIAIESIAAQPGNGRVEILPGGNIEYTPNPGFSGTDRFVYTLVDGYSAPDASDAPSDGRGAGRDLGEVLVGVMPASPANRPPTAIDDAGFVPIAFGSDPVELAVLANDSDPDSDRLSVAAATVPSLGEVRVSPGRSGVLYTPPATGTPRSVSFAYTVSDGRGGTATAQVTLELAEAPDPIAPVAVDDLVGPVAARSVVTIDPRLNDLDPDGDAASLVVESDDPALTVRPDGALDLTAPLATGEIEYRVRDEQGLVSEPAFIRVIVAPNTAPVIAPITVETPFQTPVTIDVGASVSDPDQDPLTLTIGQQRTGGSAAVATSADSQLTVTFTPDPGFDGTASFDFVVDDRHGHTVTGTATVVVLAPDNRLPVAAPATITVEAGIDAVVRIADLISDPDGPDGYVYSTSDVTGPVTVGAPNQRGEVVVGSTLTDGGTQAAFRYTVVDGPHTVSEVVTIDLIVPRFPPPTPGPDTARTLQGQPTGPLTVLDNDIDNSPAGLAGAGLAITGVGVTDGGTATVAGNAVTFTPHPDFFGRATFTYTVQDGRRAAEGEATGTVTVDVIGRPAIPQAPRVDAVGDRYVVVAWSAPAGDAARAPVTGYVLRYTGADGTSGEIHFDTPTTSYRWDGLTNSVRYCFQVAGVNEAGYGEFSAQSDASCGTPDIRPEAPAAPSVAFGDGQLTVSWSPPRNAGSPIRSYQLRMSGGRQELSAELGVGTSYTWTGLANGTDYTFEVRARNNALDNEGWSDWSPLSAPEHPLTQPAAPAAPVAQRGNRQVTITWQAPDDGGDPITLYQVRSSVNPQWVNVTPQGQVNTHVWQEIPNGTNVSFEVRAINRDPRSTNPGNISPPSATVRTCAVPDAPAAPTAARGDTQATVAWTAPNDQGCAITEYRITASTGATQTAGPAASAHVFTGLANGTPVTFTVTAINEVVTVDGAAANTSAASNSVTPAGLPRAPGSTAAANVGPRQVRVTWAAADPNGAPITTYQVSVNGTWTDVGAVTEWVHNAGSDGATYSYRVRALNDVGAGPAGPTATVTTWDVPAAPQVSASAGNLHVDGSWNAPANGGTAVDTWQARLYQGSCGSTQVGSARDGDRSPQRWTNVEYSTNYRVCVRYHNAVGWGPWGSDVATTPNPPPPQPSVDAFWGGSAQGRPGCATAGCKYLNANGTNFAANTNVSVSCWGNNGGSWYQFSNTYTIRSDGNGRVELRNYCYYGFSGTQAQVRMNGVHSDTITN